MESITLPERLCKMNSSVDKQKIIKSKCVLYDHLYSHYLPKSTCRNAVHVHSILLVSSQSVRYTLDSKYTTFQIIYCFKNKYLFVLIYLLPLNELSKWCHLMWLLSFWYIFLGVWRCWISCRHTIVSHVCLGSSSPNSRWSWWGTQTSDR